MISTNVIVVSSQSGAGRMYLYGWALYVTGYHGTVLENSRDHHGDTHFEPEYTQQLQTHAF